MQITASMVKELRERTGAGMMECKEALSEAKGGIDDAIAILRKKGLAAVAKRAHRATSEGIVGSYIHPGGRIGVLVEVNCETDFVARTDEFQQLVKDLGMQVAASAPRFLAREEVTVEILSKESDQPLWKEVRAGHDDDIKPQKLSRYPQCGVNCRRLVIPFMKNLRQRRLHLLLERRPHHKSDHQQIQEKHGRLANSVSFVAFLFCEMSPRNQGCSHDELHDEVEIRPEGCASAEKALH